jgi:hypothetical protein
MLVYITGLEDVITLRLKPKGSKYFMILKNDFPYSSEIDIFLESIMRNFTSNVFNIIITLHGLKYWYYNEVFARSLGFPILVKR